MSEDSLQDILERGIVYQRNRTEPLDSTLLRLDQSFLPQMMALQDLILAKLSHPHMLQPFPEEFMRLHLGEKGFALGVVADSRLIAFRNTYFPDRDEPEWNLGPDLQLPSQYFDALANLQFSCVHPEFRGNNLGYRMMQRALQLIKTMGKYQFCCATVSPLNYWSVDILLRNGFTLRNLKSKYGGKLRYLTCQNLKKSMEPEIESVKTVGLTDFKRQQELFAQGLCGVKLRKIAGIPPLPRETLAQGYELIFARQPLY